STGAPRWWSGCRSTRPPAHAQRAPEIRSDRVDRIDLRAILEELKRSADTFGPLIRQQAEQIPDRIALRFEDQTVTYGAYNQAVNCLADVLRRKGVTPGVPVAIFCLNSPLFLAALGAVAKLGALAALLHTHLTGAGLTHVLRASEARVGIVDAHGLAALDAVTGTHPVRFLAETSSSTPLPPGIQPLEGSGTPPEPDIPDVRGGDVFLY